MAFDGTDNCWIPRVPITDERQWRLRVSQFGDGYQQRILDGINALDQRWSLTWQSLADTVLFAMDDYLTARKGAAFPFKHPVSGVTYSVFCDEWQLSWELRRRGDVYYGSLAAEFYIANGVTVAAIP
jgi:phage-related protein